MEINISCNIVIFIYSNKVVYVMERETRSIKINPVLWKEVKKHCVEKEISMSDYLEQLIKKDMKKT